MNTWVLTQEQREKFKPIVLEYISKINNTDECELVENLNLTFKEISPYQLKELLEELGYEKTDFDKNGWECDFWITMQNKNVSNRAQTLCIFGCGMSFKLELGVKEDY